METRRLILRRYKEEDLEDFYAYMRDEEVLRYEPYKPKTYEEAKKDLQNRIQNEAMIAIERKEDHRMIGNLYFAKEEWESMELGYVFNKEFWKQGYGTESCSALIDYAFQQGIHRIFAMCDPNNLNSWKLLERLSFVREAHLHKNVYFFKDEQGRPIWKDTYIYSLLRENYDQNKKNET